MEYLEENHIIFKSQHGFRKGRSTLTKLLAHFDNVLTGLLDGEDTDAIYLDYAKAFDKVDYELLIQKLRAYGFSSCFTDWISSFLSDRVQTVVVQGHHSVEARVVSGVPQGTFFGLILFIIFVYDLENKIDNSDNCFFADDTPISKRISSLCNEDDLQNDLHSVLEWSK